MRIRRRPLLAIAAGALVVAALVLVSRRGEPRVQYQTAVVDRGDIVDVVGATGTLQAVTTVQVGSQVSGTIQSLHADFNDRVTRGQVIVRLDPSLFQARLEQAQANLISARANVDRMRAALEDARQKLQRARELSAENLLPAADLETAQANDASAAAQLKAADAEVSQAAASLNQAQVDLAHTVIRAPIDGVVVARNVDVGQTVAASLQAPTLFVIANDLSQMQVNASVDEADIGRVRPQQEVTFRVDAYPDRVFAGRVQQVRLQPTVEQNVVTYNTIIAVENPRQQLMPGMTATVSIVVQRVGDVLRVPASALRFRPPGFEPGARPGGGDGLAGRLSRPAAAGDGGFARADTAPDRRTADAGPPGAGAPRGEGAAGRADGTPGVVFVPGPEGEPQPRRIRIGLSDGQYTEVRSGLEEGAIVVTGIDPGARGASPRPSGSPGTNPFNPQFQRRQR